MIAHSFPNSLSTSISDLGAGRWVYWDVVDGKSKYGLDFPSGTYVQESHSVFRQ